MAPMKALLLSDGRPGHYHLAEGILAAIGRRRSVETLRVEISRRPWVPGRLLARLARSGLSPRALLRAGYGLDGEAIPRADLIVSAGGDTLAANVAAARLLNVPNIFYGSLRRFAPQDFTLVLTSHAQNAARPRHVVTLKPSAIDPDTLPSPAPLNGSLPAVAGLLVGGETATIRYSAADWSRLVAFLRALNAVAGTRWIVSNSRRTPAAASDALAALAQAKDSPVRRFIDVRHDGAGTLRDLFAASEAVFCTADSSSMVSETVWVRRPLIAVEPERCALPGPERQYRDWLDAQGWARTIPLAQLTPEHVKGALREIAPLAANPLDLLAATLAERLPGIFSGAA